MAEAPPPPPAHPSVASVFLNCPFDPAYAPLMNALVFAVSCCGFLPRSALETGTVSEPRLARITRALFTSDYSIHDLSRCTGEGDENTARFNMPLELGMAMARRFAGAETEKRHDWLVLVPEGHPYVKFVSDLAAYDLVTHSGTPESLVPRVVAWLATRPDAVRPPTPRRVLAALPRFVAQHKKMADEWAGALSWANLVVLAADIARTL